MKAIVKSVADKTTEYLLTLPNGTNTTVYQAAMAACAEELEQLEFMDLFILFHAVLENIEKTDVVLDLSEHDDKVEGLFFKQDFYVYRKRLQKAQIISDLLCYGPCPEPDEPVEQRLTISSTGRIWFSERVFGPLGDNHYPIGKKIQMSIGKERAAAILSKLADYADSNPLLMLCTDIGSWHLTLTASDGTKKEMTCSMNGDVFVGDDDLTEFIRARIPIDGLAVFGGGSEKEVFDEDSDLEC